MKYPSILYIKRCKQATKSNLLFTSLLSSIEGTLLWSTERLYYFCDILFSI